MRFTFKFLMANGHTKLYTFVASAGLAAAYVAAGKYSRLAFDEGELLDFYWAGY